jgi:ABC-2 type transport system permease protein
MRKGLAFLKRDLLIEASYRFNFLLTLVGILFSASIFYFLGKIVPAEAVKGSADDYFSFALLGMAFAVYLRTGLGSFAESLREEQMMGTLEAMLATPTSLSTIVISCSLWRFLLSSVNVIAYLLVGAALGISFAGLNLPAALILLLLTVTAYSALGILSASLIMVFKRGDPINFVVSNLSLLLGGVYFPVSLLPGWLRFFSRLLPITYSLEGMRGALLQGKGITELRGDILALLAISAVLLPLSLLLFRAAVNHARRAGTLVKY